jgi:hypothetical protein
MTHSAESVSASCPVCGRPSACCAGVDRWRDVARQLDTELLVMHEGLLAIREGSPVVDAYIERVQRARRIYEDAT